MFVRSLYVLSYLFLCNVNFNGMYIAVECQETSVEPNGKDRQQQAIRRSLRKVAPQVSLHGSDNYFSR